MYTYRSVETTSTGDLRHDSQNTNSIAVYDTDDQLKAVYVHAPDRATQARSVALYVGLCLGFVVLLGWMVQYAPSQGSALASSILYIFVLGVTFWAVTMPEITPVKDAPLLISALEKSNPSEVEILTSRADLFKKYPPKDYR